MFRVFVYGSLKPGYWNYERYCAKKIVEAQPALARGELYNLNLVGFPAMTAGDRWVQGFVLSFTDFSVLDQLDSLEGFNANRAVTENQYSRQLIEVFDLTHQSLGQVWVYKMNLEKIKALGGVLLPEGEWETDQMR